MNCNKKVELYGVLALSKVVDDLIFPNLIKILKREKIQDCLEFLSQDLNLRQVGQEIQQVEIQSLFGQKYMVNVGDNNIKRIINVLKKTKDHEFNEQNYSMDEYEEIKKNLFIKISQEKKIIEFLKFLVHLTAFDERYIQCGTNSLHILIQMKVDLREQSFENIRIRNTSLFGANLVRCDLSGSDFENVIISGINLNQAKLFNCKWRNLRINELSIIKGHCRWVKQVSFSLDGEQLVSCSADKSIRLLDVKSGKIISIIRGKGQVKSVCFSPHKNTLAFSIKKYMYIWNIKTGKQISKLNVHLNSVNSVCFSPDGTTFASCSGDNSIRLWDVKTGQQKDKLDGHSSSVNSICFSPDGTTLASGSGDNSIRLWDVNTGQQKAKLDGHSSTVYSVNFSPDGTILASGSSDNSISLWNVKTGQQKSKLDCHSSCVNSICFSPDGISLASGCDDISIRFWDVKTGQQNEKLDGHSSYVNSICYSPDGATLASGSSDNTIRLWDVKTGQQKAKLNGHQYQVNSICFSPDGNTLASGSSDYSICIWDLISGHQTLPLDKYYIDILTQFLPLKFKNNVISEIVSSATQNITILKITQNPNLEVSGTLIYKGEFIDKKGYDLRSLFKSKGCCILEAYLQSTQN